MMAVVMVVVMMVTVMDRRSSASATTTTAARAGAASSRCSNCRGVHVFHDAFVQLIHHILPAGTSFDRFEIMQSTLQRLCN